MKKVKVYMGLPTMGSVSDCQAYMLREMAEKYKDKVELVYPVNCVRRMFHDFARNAIVEDFLKTDCDVLWFLDSDIGPNHRVLELVTEHYDSWLLAGAPYPVFMTADNEEDPKIVFCVYKAHENDKFSHMDVPQDGLAYVDGLATGCLMIKREVFATIPAPWFEFSFDSITRQPTYGEDLSFCLKAHKAGLKFFTDFGMVCKHYKNVCLLEINNYTINMRNQAVLAYDSQVRDQINQLEAVVRKLLAERKAPPKPKSGILLFD